MRAIEEYLGKSSATETQPAPPAPPLELHQQPPSPRPLKVGTTIQRCDRVNERKRQILLTQPPPPPERRPIRPYEKSPALPKTEPPPAPEEILRLMGPMTAPPIKFEVEPSIIVEVPHFAIHVSRRYKSQTPQGRWSLRFSADGKLRYKRKIN